nr:hypothetical protein BaRGS_033975 [Batillaria attramentaria]
MMDAPTDGEGIDNHFTFIHSAVFGNTGLHMVLRGKVAPLTEPYVYTGLEDDELDLRSPTPLLEDTDTVLEVGDCFGTLQKIEGKEASTRLCPSNRVIVSEGYKAPFIGFIKSGECHVLRQVDVLHTLCNGKKEKRTKQVVMGKLGPSDSFAEISLLLEEPITCSIVTATDVSMGVVRPERIRDLDEVTIQLNDLDEVTIQLNGKLSLVLSADLDEVTIQLFKQCNTRTFGNLTKEDIQNEYMQQEQKRAWNEFKHGMVVDVINAQGIRPGYGKWAK